MEHVRIIYIELLENLHKNKTEINIFTVKWWDFIYSFAFMFNGSKEKWSEKDRNHTNVNIFFKQCLS